MNKDTLSIKSADVVLCLVTGLLILLPFLAISFYNHPVGDDYWCTGMVRRYGFWNAQVRLYDIVPPRYFALGISSLAPLAFGNSGGYRIIPILFFVVFTGVVIRSFKTLQGEDRWSDKYIYLYAFLFVCTYLAVMPGIGEGIYWTSSLCVYHVGLLLFVLWCNALVRWYYVKRSGYDLAAACLFLAGMFGCNEIIPLICVLIVLVMVLYKVFHKDRIDLLLTAQLAVTILWVLFVIRYHGSGNRYSQIRTEGSGRWFYSIGLAVLADGYYIGRCLINPFFWAVVIAGYGPFVRWSGSFYVRYRRLFDFPVAFFCVWAFILFIIPFVIIFLTGERPPLRVSNMIVFFFLSGLAVAGVFLVNREGRARRPAVLFPGMWRYRVAGVLLLLATGFIMKNNVSLATRDLLSGNAARYDRALNDRYASIQKCVTDTCVVPVLERIPATFLFYVDCGDDHVSDYFNKVIVVSGKLH